MTSLPPPSAPSGGRLKLERDLRRALAQRELRVYFQPVVSLARRMLLGFEALVRWQHPTQGLVSPAAFVPFAEEAGPIGQIDEWVLEEACRQFACWYARTKLLRPYWVSVNVSTQQLHRPELAAQIGDVLAARALSPAALRLEITERVMVADVEAARHAFRQLKSVGVRLAVDDFGTGYSALSYLHRFPLDILKIGEEFVRTLGTEARSTKIVKAVIRLAHSLGMEVIAEGIEMPMQLALLRATGCEGGQGSLFGLPRPFGEVITEWRQHSWRSEL